MKVKAILKGNVLWIKSQVKLKQDEVEINLPDEYIESLEESKGKRFLGDIWDTVNRFPKSDINWKEEWYKHLEKRYE